MLNLRAVKSDSADAADVEFFDAAFNNALDFFSLGFVGNERDGHRSCHEGQVGRLLFALLNWIGEKVFPELLRSLAHQILTTHIGYIKLMPKSRQSTRNLLPSGRRPPNLRINSPYWS